jgi:integrase/recombinase XerC
MISHDYDIFEGVNEAEEVEQAPRWLVEKDYLRFMREVEKGMVTARTEAGRWMAVRDRAVVALMVWAGLREGEVCALEAGDVTLSERKGEVVVRLGKGGKRRVVPLGLEARRAVGEWMEMHSQDEQDSFLFVGRRGERLGVRGVQRMVKAIGARAKVDVTPHVLRHTFCKRMLEANAKELGAAAMVMVAELAGHARLDTTRRYVRPGREELEKAVERI